MKNCVCQTESLLAWNLARREDFAAPKIVSPVILNKKHPITAQVAEGGLWRTDATFQPVFMLKNLLDIAPMDVTPVLYMQDGTEDDLPQVHLDPAGVAMVNISTAFQVARKQLFLAKDPLHEQQDLGYRKLSHYRKFPPVPAAKVPRLRCVESQKENREASIFECRAAGANRAPSAKKTSPALQSREAEAGAQSEGLAMEQLSALCQGRRRISSD